MKVIEFLLGIDIDENFQVTEFLNVNMWKDMFREERKVKMFEIELHRSFNGSFPVHACELR